jgi:3-isopropylmalate/(R)-2-methylmalate dehydratase small subunit
MFEANRPGWSAQVQPGDILVAGRNYGMGSGRPAAQVMKDLGLVCLLAESLNGLFLRNCVNLAFPALEIPGVHAAFEEGDEAEVDFTAGRIKNRRTGVELLGAPWPESALQTLKAGGLEAELELEGLLHPVGWTPASGN